jgi:hypothetical protein
LDKARLSVGTAAPLIEIGIFAAEHNRDRIIPFTLSSPAEAGENRVRAISLFVRECRLMKRFFDHECGGVSFQPSRRIAAQLLTAIALVLLANSVTFAHAYLVKSIPAQRAVLLRAPAKIQLWFNEPLEARYSGLTIVDPAGKNVNLTHVEIGGADPKLISATVDTFSAGTYTVKYRVLSVDGHIAENQFPFTIKK